MKAVWLLFWQLCRLRIGPEDMPGERAFTVLIVAMGWALSVLVLWQERGDFRLGLSVTSVITAVDVMSLYALLSLTRKANRFPQTLTALAGADVVITLIQLPFVMLGSYVPEKSPFVMFFWMAGFGLFAWELAIRGYIYHRSLQVGVFQANLLAFALMLLSLAVSVKLFPEMIPTPSK